MEGAPIGQGVKGLAYLLNELKTEAKTLNTP